MVCSLGPSCSTGIRGKHRHLKLTEKPFLLYQLLCSWVVQQHQWVRFLEENMNRWTKTTIWLRFNVLTNVVTILMSAKMATLHLHRIKIFWNSITWLILYMYISNSSISMRKVITTSILWGFGKKNHFFFRSLGSSSITWEWHQTWSWNFTLVWQKDYMLKSESFGG